MAAAEASLRTLTDSMSAGSTESSEPPITPSIITSGSALAPNVLSPRNLILKGSLGLPPTRAIFKPATLPCNNCCGSLILPTLNEGKNLEILIDRVLKTKHKLDILIINDDTNEESLKYILDFKKKINVIIKILG